MSEVEAPSSSAPTAWARRNIDHLIGGGIATAYVGWLLATARTLGFSRDEGFYFRAAATTSAGSSSS